MILFLVVFGGVAAISLFTLKTVIDVIQRKSTKRFKRELDKVKSQFMSEVKDEYKNILDDFNRK
jgi:hypothetical protein